MGNFIRFEVHGTLKAALRFEKFPDQLRDDLLAEINALGREAFEMVSANTPRRTGRLAGEEQLLIVNEPNVVGAIINFGAGATANDAKKAGALEYGSTGKPQEVSGRVWPLDHVWSRKLAEPLIAIAQAYERTPNIFPEFMVRGPMAALQGQALERLQAVVNRAVDTSNQED